MADDPENLEEGTPAPTLVEQVLATRASRQDEDQARRDAWVAARAAEEAAQLERAAAAKRIRAAAHAGKPADPADVALALGSEDLQ